MNIQQYVFENKGKGTEVLSISQLRVPFELKDTKLSKEELKKYSYNIYFKNKEEVEFAINSLNKFIEKMQI